MMKLFSLKEQQKAGTATGDEGDGRKKQSAAQLRMNKDMSDLVLPKTCTLSYPDPDNLLHFQLVIQPDENEKDSAEQGFYRGGRFAFTYTVNHNYPHDPPKVKCTTPVYHPNIDLDGNVCLNILREEWKPVLNTQSVIYGLQYLFLEPNPDDPLNREAATVLRSNRAEFEYKVAQAMQGARVDGHKFEYCLARGNLGRQANMPSVTDMLASSTSLTLHTGDINTWTALKQCQAANSAEELSHAIRLQIQAGCVDCGVERDASLDGLDRGDLKVTLKVFLGSVADGASAVDECVQGVFEHLHTDMLEQLIVAFPDMATADMTEGAGDEAETKEFIRLAWPTWKAVERHVDEQRVLRVGVGDMELSELRALRTASEIAPPVIDHYNIDACCEVPEELKEYASEEHVLLLTHNDPRDFVQLTRLRGVDESAKWRAAWIGRYTVLINSRSVIIKKGYIVRFVK